MAEREVLGRDFLATATDMTLTPQVRRLRLDQMNTGYEQRGLMGKQVDDAMKLASGKAQGDNELDYAAVTRRLHDLQYDKESNVLPVDQFPLRDMDNVLEDPKLFNTAKVYDNFVSSKVAPKETYQQASGGKPGTYSRSFTDEIRFLKKNADGSPYRDPVTHKTQTEITPELLEKAMENPRIKRDLNGLMADHKALTDSAEAKMANYEQLTSEERAALEVEPNLTDLLGRRLSAYGYANHRETQRYNRYPQPRAASGGRGGAGVVTFDERNVTAAEVGASIAGAPGAFKEALGIDQFTPVQQNFYTSRRAGAPTIPQKNGTNKPVEIRLTPRRMTTEDAKGQLTRRTNNKTPIEGIGSEIMELPVHPTTGEEVYPKNQAEEDDYLRQGYKRGSFVAITVDKNEKFFADRERYIRQEMETNKRAENKKTYSEIEAEATRVLSKGTSRVIVPYDRDNASTLNNQVGRYYLDFDNNTRRRGPAAAPAAPKAKLRIGVPAPVSAPTPAAKNGTPIDRAHLPAAQAAADKAYAAAEAANKTGDESYRLAKAAFDKVLAEKASPTGAASRRKATTVPMTGGKKTL